jgi:hypothetical protein
MGIKSAERVNSIANICFIPKALNDRILDKKPSVYFEWFRNNKDFSRRMASHLIPIHDPTWIDTDNYDLFLKQRAELIRTRILQIAMTTRLLPSGTPMSE